MQLQAANEGLQTLREEIRDSASRLEVRAAHLRQQLEELSQANLDLEGLLDASEAAMLLLDCSLCIRRFNPSARD